jgi:hypothetical protein
MLAPVVSHQRLGDGVRAGLDPAVAQCSQRMRVTLPRQSLAAFRHYQELIAACDREIAQSLEEFESKVDPPPGSTSLSEHGSKPKTSEPGFDLQTHLHRIFGVDLTQVPGINVLTAQTLLAPARPRRVAFR